MHGGYKDAKAYHAADINFALYEYYLIDILRNGLNQDLNRVSLRNFYMKKTLF